MLSDSYCWHQVQKSLLRCLLTFQFFRVTLNSEKSIQAGLSGARFPFRPRHSSLSPLEGSTRALKGRRLIEVLTCRLLSRQPSRSHPESSKELCRDKQEVALSSPSLAPLFHLDMYALKISFGLSAWGSRVILT